MKLIQWVSVSKLRGYNAAQLRALCDPIVIHSHDTPLAALIPYDLFILAQELTELRTKAAEGARP